MIGMDAETGRALSGIAHLRQSIRDILTTPVGSRVMRRDYGSRLPHLVDAPVNEDTLVAIYVATAEALLAWEPRLRLERVRATPLGGGQVRIDLEGHYRPEGRAIQLDGILV